MAATVGRLVIDLAANVAQLRTDMQSAVGAVESASVGIASAVNTAKLALGAFGVAFSIGEVKAWAEGVISSTGALNDLAQKTGSSVENLSRLANQAAVSGKDFATLEQLTLRLAVNMRDMGDGSKAAGAALQFLGVSATDPAEALIEVAKAMDGYADGVGKAALAKDLFGKNGPQFIDFLHDLAQAHGVGATRTAEQAKAADELEESWRRLKVEGTVFSDFLLNHIVPPLQNAITAFNNLRQAGFGIWGTITGPTSATEAISAYVDAQERLAELNRQMAAQAAAGNNGLVLILRQQAAEAQANVDKHEKLVAAWVRTGDTTETQGARTQAAYRWIADAAKDATLKSEDFSDEISKLATELDKLTSPDGVASEYDKALRKIEQSLLAGEVVTNASIDAFLTWAETVDFARGKAGEFKVALDEWQEQDKALRAALAEYPKALSRAATSAEDYSESLREVVRQGEFEVATLGLTAEQLRVVEAQRRIDLQTKEKLRALGSLISNDMRAQILLDAEEAKASVAASSMKQRAYQDWLDLMQTAAGGVKNFILDFVENGSSAFKRLWQNFKNWALEALAEIAAKQIVVSVVGALGLGGSAGASAAGALGLGSAGNGLSTLLGLGNSASSVAGGGSLLGGVAEGIGSTLFGSVGGGAFATGLTSPLGTITTLLGGSGGATIGAGLGMEAALGAAIPLLGLGLGVASLLGAFDSGGGPMTRNYGLAGGNLSTFSELSSLHKLVGTDATEQSSYDAIAQGMLSTYNTVLQQLGIAGGANAAFALYTSQDPQGSALSTVDVRAMLGGQSVYTGNTGETVARTQEALQAAIGEQVTAAILAAISASGVSQQTVLAAWQGMTPAEQAQNQSLYSYLMQNTQAPVAIDNFGTAATQQSAAATTMESAANTIAGAATQLAGASAQMAGAATTYQDATATYYDAAIQRYLQTGMP